MRNTNWKNTLWFLPVMGLVTVLLMGQHPHKKHPSPADPGMTISKPGPNNGNPESPTISDPTAGDEPGEEDDGIDIDIREFPMQSESLRITGMDLSQIESGSDVGKPGDYMVILHGTGFLEAERPPKVHIGDQVTLEEVYVNEDLGELYAVLPSALASSLDLREFMQLAVQNPGAGNLDPRTWVRFPVVKLEFLAAIRSASPASFKENNYHIQKMK